MSDYLIILLLFCRLAFVSFRIQKLHSHAPHSWPPPCSVCELRFADSQCNDCRDGATHGEDAHSHASIKTAIGTAFCKSCWLEFHDTPKYRSHVARPWPWSTLPPLSDAAPLPTLPVVPILPLSSNVAAEEEDVCSTLEMPHSARQSARLHPANSANNIDNTTRHPPDVERGSSIATSTHPSAQSARMESQPALVFTPRTTVAAAARTATIRAASLDLANPSAVQQQQQQLTVEILQSPIAMTAPPAVQLAPIGLDASISLPSSSESGIAPASATPAVSARGTAAAAAAAAAAISLTPRFVFAPAVAADALSAPVLPAHAPIAASDFVMNATRDV